eukprot:m.71360 g.71360  ORF g.71360 m.71360 type:complete len:74 (+) comp7935_c0_seq4:1910-2131(+)
MSRLTMHIRHDKMIAESMDQRIENLRKAEEEYRYIIQYCDRNPETHKFETELSLCREMLEMIPLRIAQARASG